MYSRLLSPPTLHLFFVISTGTLPPSLGQLSHVRTVFLHMNNFRGTIPSSIGQCHELRNLQLWSNRLEGPVPTSLAKLQHIELLVLCGNSGLKGAEPIAQALRERRGAKFRFN